MNEIIDLIVSRIKLMQIPMWDVYYKFTDIYENQYRKFDVEITRHAQECYYFIRTFYEKGDQFGVGIIKANSMEPEEIDLYIKQSQILAKLNMSNKYSLPQPGQLYPQLKTAEAKVINDPEGVLNEKSEELLNVVSDLKQVKPTFGKLRIYVSKNGLRNSEELSLESKKTSFYLEFPLKAEYSGKLAEFWGITSVKNSIQLDFQNRLSKWAEIALDSLTLEVPKSAKAITAIFPPKIVRNALAKTIGYHSTGHAFHEKLSRFKKGAKVAKESFSLIDNGIMKDGIAVANWDGEGNPQRANSLINKGAFNEFLFDEKYAALEKVKSTGNGIRTEDGTILNSITNLEINAGSESLEELIESIKYGIFIEEFSWLNPSEVTGDFGAEIRNAYLIKNGKRTVAIKGGNLSGNVFEMINAIEGISKNQEIEENYKFPFIKFSGLILSA
ncbi:MAG TPA: metallopeptidase TldD-related protein [Candidatus Deferrimicrobium sp.]|nr:metallopeptidase TldD-related protein [Candidatus Deferrimicrobium sp.]